MLKPFERIDDPSRRLSATEYLISTLDFAYNHLSSQTLFLANMPLVTVSDDKDKFIAHLSLRQRNKSYNTLLEKKKSSPTNRASLKDTLRVPKRSKSTPIGKASKRNKIDESERKIKMKMNKEMEFSLKVESGCISETVSSDYMSIYTKYVLYKGCP